MAVLRFLVASLLAAALLVAAPGVPRESTAVGIFAASCEITGTRKDETIVGTRHDDVICARGGADTIEGREGNDVLRGDHGQDLLKGGEGDDALSGGLGIDKCRQNGGSGPTRECEWPNPLKACPVRRGEILDNFGDPRSGGRTHHGDDILADRGTPIHAPFGGKTKNSRSELGGRTVTVYGKEGFAYNAHMSKHTRERKVEAGEVIGYVGKSGNAKGGPPHDHFEWHPGNGDAVDPYRYLKKACS